MNLKIKKMKKIFSLLILLFISQIAFSQQFSGKINAVSQSGLHQIQLSPEVRSAAKNNIDFVRILDSKKNEVPYVFFNGKTNNSQLENFVIISKKAVHNVATSVIVSNENGIKLNHLNLKIANTEVDKKYSISGSNDNKEWFGLVNNQMLTNLNEAGKTSVERTFSFPLNNYKYLKFDFVDKNSLPIHVLEVNLKKNSTVENSKIELQNFNQKISTDKTNKKTTIGISFKTPQIINGIQFEVVAPNYYLREARIIVQQTGNNKKRAETYPETKSFFSLNSKTENKFEISELFTKDFIIEIDNQDNPELQIKKIQLFQNPVNILADLKAGENYTLKIDPKLEAPNYDLAQSGINFNQNYPAATISSLENMDNSEKELSEKTFWQNPLFMWVCIVLAVVIIGYFSIAMIKDMNKEN